MKLAYLTFVLLAIFGLMGNYEVLAQSKTIKDCEKPFSIGSVKLQIISVKLGPNMFAPVGMKEDETVLAVELKVLSGDAAKVAKLDGEFDVWITNEADRRNSTRGAMTTSGNDHVIQSINCLFGVFKSSESFFLKFPNGVTVELTTFLN